jgi:hypothetical protein
MARARTALWLLGLVLAGCWSSVAGLEVPQGPSRLGGGAATSTRETQSPQPYALAREPARIVASETHRQKPVRSQHDGKRFGIVAEGAPEPPVARRESTPSQRSDVPWSAPFRAFQPRGPPSRIA